MAGAPRPPPMPPSPRIDFAFGASHRLRMACQVVARHVQAGRQLVVYCRDERRLEHFDKLLWSFDDTAFIPHVRPDDPLAEQAAVWLCKQLDPWPAALSARPAAWLLNLDLACPPPDAPFSRVLEIVSTHPDDRAAARERWREYDARGCTLKAHDLSQRDAASESQAG